MQTEIILKYYWELFLSHVCEFHPLGKDFIEKYEYELDWHAISKNKVIDWNTAFIEKYEERFLWHELARNESIPWAIERIDRFKKRLDWYYLLQNKSLPLSDDFVQKFSKKLSYVQDNNTFLTKELKTKYKLRVVPANEHDTQELKKLEPGKVDEIFHSYAFYHNQYQFYKKVFLPIIEEQGLKKIFADKFDYGQRYYFLEPVEKDISGLTPEFRIDGDNPFSDFREGLGIFEIKKPLVLTSGPLQEGPDRLYEIPRFSLSSLYPILLVSEHVKAVLEQFKLPKHVFHPIQLVPKKITAVTRYFIFQAESDTLLKDLDYAQQPFHFFMNAYDERVHGEIEKNIRNYDQLREADKETNKKLSPVSLNTKVYPEAYRLLTDYDLYSYPRPYFIVNQFLKDALEKNFPGQMAFRSAQLLRIGIDQNKYAEKAKLSVNTKISSRVSYKQPEEDKYYFAKMERLEASDPPFADQKTGDDKFAKTEFELNVLFPQNFKNKLLRKTLKLNGYKPLPINKFYLENEYADRYPETYKSVVIAENGHGDSINLLLEKDSDHKLQDKLFEFFHETGEYEEI